MLWYRACRILPKAIWAGPPKELNEKYEGVLRDGERQAELRAGREHTLDDEIEDMREEAMLADQLRALLPALDELAAQLPDDPDTE